MAKKKRVLPRRGREALIRGAAEDLLSSLTDDHEDCRVCDYASGHDPEASCGRLLALVRG